MSLTRFKWVEYVPDIGNNRELEAPLTLEVRTGLTRKELQAYAEGVAKAYKATAALADRDDVTLEEYDAAQATDRAAMVAALDGFVRLKGKHTFDGKPLETMEHYLEALATFVTVAPVKELLGLVSFLNTFTEQDALFSERLSGGLATTPRRSAAKKDEKTGAR